MKLINIFEILKKAKGTLIQEYHTELWKVREGYKLQQFNNIHTGKDCFIIGNGPSLNKMDLSLLNDYYTFGLNKIFLIQKTIDFKFHYYVAINRLVIEQSITEINNIDCYKFISYSAGKNIINSDENTFFIKSGPGLFFQTKLDAPINEGYTVTYVAMQIAYHMGFKNVYLVGVDHYFKQSGKPNSIDFLENDDLNHFDPSYFKGMNWNLADLTNSEISYHLAKKSYKEKNRNIYDATIDGKLNIFPKITFNEALKKARKK